MPRRKKTEEAKPEGVTITWLGEDRLHEDGNGPRKNSWNGVEFVIGEPVQIHKMVDPDVADGMVEKAIGNPFYQVDGLPEAEAEAEAGETEDE